MPIDPEKNSALLKGKSAAVACSPEKSEKLLRGLQEMGAAVVPLAVIAIRETEDKGALDSVLSRLGTYSWIIFTSSYAAQFFTLRAKERGRMEELSELRNICAVGPATAATLRKLGIQVSLLPEEFVAEGVLRALADRHGGLHKLAHTHILLPRAKEARDVLPRELVAAGAEVEIVTCYETIAGEISPQILCTLRARLPDLLVFTSSSSVRNFMNILGKEEGTRFLDGAVVAALGPVTAGTVESFGKSPEVVPRESTIPALLHAIRDFFA